MKSTYVRAATAVALFMALSASAGAQERPAAPGVQGREGRAAEFQKRFVEMRQRHEQRLHDLLQIKPDQEAAFKTYLAAIEPQPKPGEGGPGHDGQRGERAPMTTLERLDRMTARIDVLQQRVSATRTFYGALSPDQRKAFDVMPRMGEGGHHGFGRVRFEGRFGSGPGRPGFDGPPPPR